MLYGNASPFLQALGWATLNSFWQIALLWYAFVIVSRLFKLSASAKHSVAVTALVIGFAWALLTGILYYQNAVGSYAFFLSLAPSSDSFLNVCLFSASVTYLLLLAFPAMRLYKSWRFVKMIQNEPAQKADLGHRLFVNRIAVHLGIAKKVKLVVSALVSSPVTVGYLKPMILLPAAALNSLSTAQVEAILLHELSHIRRYDYVLNFLVSVIHTLLYFNPFVKFFVSAVESERETCCDELVLQFGYDKIGYASALLQLEKLSGNYQALALAAAGQRPLLTRIQKIVGMEKKKSFRLVQIVPLAFALLCLLFINSFLLVKDAQAGKTIIAANDAVFMPWQFEQNVANKTRPVLLEKNAAVPPSGATAMAATQINIEIFNGHGSQNDESAAPIPSVESFVPVNFDDVDGRLTKEEKEAVASTVETTKKVMGPLQWKEIETSLGDVLNKREKAAAKQEYLSEINNLNWQNVEQNLKSNYDRINCESVHNKMNLAMLQLQADSLQTIYMMALTELQKAEKEAKSSAKVKMVPLPDSSLEALDAAKQTLRKNLDSLKAAKPKKIVRL